MTNVIKGMIIGFIAGTLLMILLTLCGHIELGGTAMGVCELLGICIGSMIK